MPSFSDIATRVDENIRKGLDGIIAVAPMSVATEITKLKDATGLLALPSGYKQVGRITKADGVTWTRDVSTSEVTSLGAASPTRIDITGDTSGLQFTAQESNRDAMSMYEGINLDAVTHDANGNVSWDKPDAPAQIFYRALALFKDGEGADAVYFAKWLPRAQVTDRSEQVWQEESEIQYGMTLTAFNDSTFGTSVRTLWAGSTTAMTRMGFPATGP